MAAWGPVARFGSVSLLAAPGAAGPSPMTSPPTPVAPPARSPEPPPSPWSRCSPLTDPAEPDVSPRFGTDRLRTTHAPRIGRPDLHVCRAAIVQAAQHPYPSFPS